MVHSDLKKLTEKVCKRRRFLSDLKTELFLSQSSQDRFWPKRADSGGASLHLLTS